MGFSLMFQWCSLSYVEHLLEAYWYIGSLFWISPGILSRIPNFMRSRLVHGKARPQVSFGPALCPWPTNSFYGSYFGHWTLGLSFMDRSKFICHFNFDLNPVCKTCSWNLSEVSKNDLKKCVLEIAAWLGSQGEDWSALLGQSAPPQILCACTLPDLRPSLFWNALHPFLPCFSLFGNFTKVRSASD